MFLILGPVTYRNGPWGSWGEEKGEAGSAGAGVLGKVHPLSGRQLRQVQVEDLFSPL